MTAAISRGPRRRARLPRALVGLGLTAVLAASACSAGGRGSSYAGPSTTATGAPSPAAPSVGQSPGSTVAASPTAAIASRLQPKGGILVGMNLDWGHDSAAAVSTRLGRTPAVWVQFISMPMTAADSTNLDGFIDQVAAMNGIAMLTLQPMDGLAAVDDATIASFVRRLEAINARGVPVLIRFAHEMNGSWYPWGEQPTAYVAAFRRLATAVHRATTASEMLWAPNEGSGYPFSGGQYEAKRGTADFTLLDTNHDGKLTLADDPYAPYYPGDDAVDWVGMSLYHWGPKYPWGANVIPEPTKFGAQLTGSYDGLGGDDRILPDFYGIYAGQHHKPMAIPETAAFYRPALGGPPSELEIKQAWWREVFSTETLEQFPQIRLIGWFEWRKFETEVSDTVDWRVSADPQIAAAFVGDLPSGFQFTTH